MKTIYSIIAAVLFLVLGTSTSFAQVSGNVILENGAERSSAGNIIMPDMGNIIVGNGGDPDRLKYAIDPETVDIGVPDPVYIPEKKEDKKEDKITDVIVIEKKVREYHSYVAVFNFSTQKESATEAERDATAKLKQLRYQLSRIGVSSDNIVESFVSLVPTYTYDNDNPYADGKKRHTGFELKKQFRITFTDYDKLQGIISRANTIGLQQLDKVEHVIERY